MPSPVTGWPPGRGCLLVLADAERHAVALGRPLDVVGLPRAEAELWQHEAALWHLRARAVGLVERGTEIEPEAHESVLAYSVRAHEISFQGHLYVPGWRSRGCLASVACSECEDQPG